MLKERKAEDGSQSLALLLTSGGFRTAETKAILNEALKPMALRVESNDAGAGHEWILWKDSVLET